MWVIAKLVMVFILTLVLIVVVLFLSDKLGFGDEVNGSYDFDPRSIPQDLNAYLNEQEAQVPNLRQDLRKQIIWAETPGEKQDLAIVYFHGFSGSNQEMQPVPQRVARALGANLYLGRWTGHGRDGDSMGEARGKDWLLDAAEGLEIGSRIGERVILMGTSFGGSMATIAATDAEMSKKIDAIVLTVPNFALVNSASIILTWPGVRIWGPWVAGKYREFEPKNELHRKYWTPRYPNQATISLGQITKFVQGRRYEDIAQPTLFLYSNEDTVVQPQAIREAIKRWGGPTEVEVIRPGDGIDVDGHVVTGDALSPGSTEFVIDRIIQWAKGL